MSPEGETQEQVIVMSTQMQIEVDNLKCGGCARTITRGLADLAGVSDVQVNRDSQLVTFTADKALRANVAEKLRAMGYPEKGSVHGVSAAVANAKSFVSCAIGRVS